MDGGAIIFWEGLVFFQRELLFFSGLLFVVGAIDEFAIDITWIWVFLTGRSRTDRLSNQAENQASLSGPVAVFVAAWQESEVIGQTLRHMLAVWPHRNLRIYLGCYRNDPVTAAAALAHIGYNRRVRIVVHDIDGPTTKGDCLNNLYRALCDDEKNGVFAPQFVIIHDAEDMVDPAELNVMDETMRSADFVQIPVLAMPQAHSRFVGGHYIEEFTEAHSKALVVRDALRVGIPAAGVGCGFKRSLLRELSDMHDGCGPFAAGSLTEDYELGLAVNEIGGRSRFVRQRSSSGRLVATRAYFPAKLDCSVRQKTRWMHGIALEGWDRMGWGRCPAEIWMRARDRRGPLSALLLAAAYLVLILGGITILGVMLGVPQPKVEPVLWVIMLINTIALLWRAGFRFGFTAREYGMREGIMAVIRIPVSNVIAMMAGRRAVVAYIRSLGGAELSWDKTEHSAHPSAERHRKQ